jgi:ubiquinone/menaquinone biosynthesis C-methylase UbiE
VSEVRVADARSRFPELQVQVAYAENLDLPDRRFDVVTCLEVLEHIPDWLSVFHSLFRFADKQVLVTVPNREVIEHMACIHCGKLTPRYGHLRSYTEESFPEMRGWRRTFRKIAQREAGRPLAVRLYRTICPYYAWLAVDYRRTT